MIYVFEGGSVVYDGSTISDSEKLQAVAVEVLPVAEDRVGKIAVLKADKATETVFYEYVDVPVTEETVQSQKIASLEQQVQQQNQAISDLTMMIASTQTPSV